MCQKNIKRGDKLIKDSNVQRCPFCGCEMRMIESKNDGYVYITLDGDHSLTCFLNGCFGGVKIVRAQYENYMIDSWNTRIVGE